MAGSGGDGTELKGTGYEIFIGALSMLSIVNLVLLFGIEDPNLDKILLAIDVVLSVTFLGDFLYRLLSARSRSDYLLRQYGWADLLASLPVAQVKILRGFRLLRVYRLLRAYGARNIARSLTTDRAGSALFTVLLLGLLVLEFGSLTVLHFEEDADGANIRTASDALWYVIVTISTVGYGDRYPVTAAGRVLGTLVIITGVGIFGTFTGYVANFFLGPRAEPDEPLATGEATTPGSARAIGEPARAVGQLKSLLADQQAAIRDLERLLGPGQSG